MRRLAVILSGLLAVQVAGAVALAVTGPDYGAFKPSEPLVAFDPPAGQEISTAAGKTEGEGEAVVLRRAGEVRREDRRVGKRCVRTCRTRGAPDKYTNTQENNRRVNE